MRRATTMMAVVAWLTGGGCSASRAEPATRVWPEWLYACTLQETGEPAYCGTVGVPESREMPSGRRIDLKVVVLLAHTSIPAPDPVLPLAGGPGQGAADLARPLAQRYAHLRLRRDLVFVDQRGTGESNGLHCPPAPTTRDLMGEIFDFERLNVCRTELSERADLTKYTTTDAAADYEAVFDALGYREVNVIGASYGTRLGLELARRFPSRIRTLTLEGVVPPSFGWPTSGAHDADRALGAVVDDCRADPGCAVAFPRFQQDIAATFARVASRDLEVSVRDPRTGAVESVPFGESDLAYATRGLLYGNDALSLPLMFQRAADGDFAAFAQAYVTRARTLEQQLARGVHLSVYCAEDVPFVDEAEASKAATGTRLETYLLSQYAGACKVWPRAAIPSTFRDPVHSRVPALLMSGRRDPVTPPWTAYQAAGTLERSRVIVWPRGGHGTDGLATGDCRTALLDEFVESADPGRLSVDCVTSDPTLRFRGASASR
jgi:pimeloyl-ACP methyl ester carboxylesterase